MSNSALKPFTKWRGILWPIYSHELTKLLPMSVIKFLIVFIFTILRDAKDTLIVTSAGSGAEAIPVLKGWIVLPAAFLTMLIYSRLSDKVNKDALFYLTVVSFLLFFALYGFLLYPFRAILCPHSSADYLTSILGKEREHWVSVYRYWMNSLFFVASELWGGMAIGLLFWGFANQITSISEAKRFYTIFSAAGDLAVIIAGPLICYYSKTTSEMDFEWTLKILMSYVLVLGVFIIAIYYFFNAYVLKSTCLYASDGCKDTKNKYSFIKSLKYLAKSRYLYSLAFMTIGYGLVFNLVEVTWKAALKLQCPDPHDYQSFMGITSFATGLVSLVVTLFIGGNVIRKCGWFFTAQLTPIITGFTGLLFLYIYLIQNAFDKILNFAGLTPLMFVVLLGALHNVLGKTSKFSFFDTTKEMAFIPLDKELKVKGKAAVDVVAARLGKSGSSWIQVVLIEFIGSGSILGVVHCLTPFVFLTTFFWIYAIRFVNKEFHFLNEQRVKKEDEKTLNLTKNKSRKSA